jgi:hypothetical protein
VQVEHFFKTHFLKEAELRSFAFKKVELVKFSNEHGASRSPKESVLGAGFISPLPDFFLVTD